MAEERIQRRLAAILAADVVGYSRMMQADEAGTLAALKSRRTEILQPLVSKHHGRIIKVMGDGVLVEFASAVEAVSCAVALQEAMTVANEGAEESRRVVLRIGVNLGEVVVDGGDLYGDGVNIAARIEALADPGGVFVSNTVHDHVRDRLPFACEDLGEQQVKNIARPVRVYALSAAAVTALPPVAATTRARDPMTPPQAPQLSIVVLPFANLSNDPEQEYFADGITDDLTTDLSRISESFVIARNTAFTYKGKSVDVRQVGRELGVRYVLEGSVRRTRNQVRVNVQLIDAETGAHLWADRFETDHTDLAEAQDAITGRLAQTLNLELVDARGRQARAVRSNSAGRRPVHFCGNRCSTAAAAAQVTCWRANVTRPATAARSRIGEGIRPCRFRGSARRCCTVARRGPRRGQPSVVPFEVYFLSIQSPRPGVQRCNGPSPPSCPTPTLGRLAPLSRFFAQRCNGLRGREHFHGFGQRLIRVGDNPGFDPGALLQIHQEAVLDSLLDPPGNCGFVQTQPFRQRRKGCAAGASNHLRCLDRFSRLWRDARAYSLGHQIDHQPVHLAVIFTGSDDLAVPVPLPLRLVQ